MKLERKVGKMIFLKKIFINSINDYEQLKNNIRNTHISQETIEELKYYIGLKCNKILIENPYSDKDYLSTYYIHYSKKYKDISKKSYRLHLYNGDIYYGFLTLRPTCKRNIGRCYIHPQLLLPEKAYLLSSRFKTNLVGNQIFIEAFPWMHQEPDVSSCAHVALWSILRFFGNKHNNYSDVNMGSVVEHIQLNYDRKIPSKGLRIEQISNLLSQYGFSTLIRTDLKSNDEIFAYIESGLPVIGIVPTDGDDAHAICVIGHGKLDEVEICDDIFEKVQYCKPQQTDIILSTKFINSIVVSDDNLFPYRLVYRDIKMIENQNRYEPQYIIDSIKCFVIPLYEKMQVTYNEVYNKVMNLLVTSNLPDLPDIKVLRLFITSSNSFKREINRRNIVPELKRIILKLEMPKFIWVAEVSGINEYQKGLVNGSIIIDATCSCEEDEPWIAFHDSKMIKYFNGNRFVVGEFEIKPYKIYTNNLEEYDYV